MMRCKCAGNILDAYVHGQVSLILLRAVTLTLVESVFSMEDLCTSTILRALSDGV
jgi:hypothetical protein